MKKQDDYLRALELGAHDDIIRSCEPIIYKILHKTKFWNMFPQDRDDMLQVGRLAVWKCIETYIPSKTKFTTFVYVVVRNKIYDYAREMKLFVNKETLTLDFEIEFLDKGVDLDYLAVLEFINTYRHKNIISDYFIKDTPQKIIAKKYKCKQQWVSYVITKFKADIKLELGEK